VAEKTLEVVLERKRFYQDSYQSLMLAVVILLLMIFAAGWLNYSLMGKRARPPEFFAMTCDGNFATLTPLSQPYLTDAQLLAWANRVITSVYSYDFVHYREQLESMSHHFTPLGWKGFGDIFRKARNLETVSQKRLLVSARPMAAPMIDRRGVINGVYTWQLTMPILVTYQNKDANIQQALNVVVNIRRVSMLQNADGVAVSQYIASEGK
jgi:intracellular multiplication protein IcmL